MEMSNPTETIINHLHYTEERWLSLLFFTCYIPVLLDKSKLMSWIGGGLFFWQIFVVLVVAPVEIFVGIGVLLDLLVPLQGICAFDQVAALMRFEGGYEPPKTLFSEVGLHSWEEARFWSPDAFVGFDKGLVAFEGGMEGAEEAGGFVEGEEGGEEGEGEECVCVVELE